MEKRQKALYKFLVSNGDKWVSQSEIARELYEHYGNAECCLEPKDYHNSTERLLILRDLQELRTNPEFEKLVISSSKGVKIATEAEFDRYIKLQYQATIRKLARIYKMAKKGGRHNQIGISGEVVESFLEKIPENY